MVSENKAMGLLVLVSLLKDSSALLFFLSQMTYLWTRDLYIWKVKHLMKGIFVAIPAAICPWQIWPNL